MTEQVSNSAGRGNVAGRLSSGMEGLAWALVRFPEVWILLFPAIYGGLAMLSPALRASGHERAGELLFRIYRGLCHQMPTRTLFLAGFPMSICARCWALAAGVVGGAVIMGRVSGFEPASPRRVRLPFLAVAIAALPMFLDGSTQLVGLRESTNVLRVVTGLILGLAMTAWLVPTLYDAFDEQRRIRDH